MGFYTKDQKELKRIKDTHYVTFDDTYLKKYQKVDSQSEEILPVKNMTAIPLSSLYEEFMNLFDEPDKAIFSESKAADNK